MPKGKDDWRGTYNRAWRTTQRFLSPHALLDGLPPGIKKPRAPAPSPPGRDVRTKSPDFTLDEAFHEQVRNGLAEDRVAEHLFEQLLTGALIITSGESVGRLWEEGGELRAETIDGHPLDPTAIVTCEGTAIRHPDEVARLRAELAKRARERELHGRPEALAAGSPDDHTTDGAGRPKPKAAQRKRPPERKPRPQEVGKRPTAGWSIINPQLELMLQAKVTYPSAAAVVRAVLGRPGMAKKNTLNPRTLARGIVDSDRFSKLIEPGKGRLDAKRPLPR